MRCKNCGWPNQPGETNCVKCHAPLDGDVVAENFTAQQEPSSSDMRKTVLETSPINASAPVGNSVCTQCGFPLRPGSTKCPKCGAPVNNGNAAPKPIRRNGTVLSPVENVAGGTVVANIIEEPEKVKEKEKKNDNHNTRKNSNTSGMKTINPYLDGFDPIPTCSLKPMKRTSERKALESIEFEGEEILLKRDNTDPDNATISIECQAAILNENGKWYIVDKSDARTTFVRAEEKTEIKEGSIILLGNRLFEFHA